MNLFKKLQERAAKDNPIRVGMIGAGKFGTMFLAQALRIPAIHVVSVVDLNPTNARSNMKLVGWADEAYTADSIDEAAISGKTYVGEEWEALVAHPAVDIVIEATGNPLAAVTHCLAAFKQGKNVINVTVEADAFCGPS